jgi:hypothetical protein
MFHKLTMLIVLWPLLPTWAFADPAQVLIIRHAEKPEDDEGPHLSSRGAARAAALPALFVVPPTFPTRPARFRAPDFIIATRASTNSNRPVETVTPLAKALGDVSIHDKHRDDDFQAMVDDLFGNAKYNGKTVLICWHHGKVPKLTQAVLARATNADKVREQVPEKWGPEVFDRVWQITFDDQGKAKFADRPQQLLFKDSVE